MKTIKFYEDENGNVCFKVCDRNPDTVKHFCENASGDFDTISREIYERAKDGIDK